MNTEVGMQKSEGRTENRAFGVNYKWLDNKGRMHLGRSVGAGRDRAHAERRFFKQHRHVFAEGGFTDVDLPVLIGTFLVLLFVIVVLSVQLTHSQAQLNSAHQDIQSLRGAVLQLSHENNTLKARVDALEGGAK